MWELFLIASVILGIVILGLGVQVFFSRRKKFPNTHIGGNPNMEKAGISCASTEDPGTCSCSTDGIKTSCHNKID